MFNTTKDFSLDAVASVLAFFYSLPVVGGSYGLAIMLLTATVMIVLMPLTLKATRSTIKMTQLQPELKKLQKEYKDDKANLNQAMMALYQEHGVNPVGGCLPMLAQLPVFLVLFNVLRGVTRRVSEKPYFAVSERAHELIGVASGPANTFDPRHLDKGTKLYQDLSTSTEMLFGPFDLASTTWQVVQDNLLRATPYILLILFVVGSSYFQQRQVSARRGAVPDNPTPQQQTQQQLLRILPLMSGVWSFLFPAGLVLYWATSNLFRIGQQAYITRALYREDASDGDGSAGAAEESKPVKADDGPKAAGTAGNGRQSKKPTAAGGAPKKSGKADSANGDSADALIGDGRPGRKNTSARNGTAGSGTGRVDRDEAWARRREQRTKAKATRKKSSAEGSSRVTPKGTKPPAAKKKRKR
ncbi:MAG: YidC/Oxa1 family membrane protein insertase [Acidimicrobiales bacterium]